MFPQAVLVQLLIAMLHSDIEVRLGAHQIFSIVLTPNSSHHRHDISRVRATYVREPGRSQPSTASTLASITARLEKLRKEKNGVIYDKMGYCTENYSRGKDHYYKNQNQGYPLKQSANLCKVPITAKETVHAGFSEVMTCS